MQDQIVLPPIELPEQFFYLYYNDEGYITDLLNYKKENGNFIQVTEDFVIDFRASNKELTNFKVEIGNNFKITRIAPQNKKAVYYRILDENTISDIVITVYDKHLHFRLSPSAVYSNDSKDIFHFYVISKSNMNFLFANIAVKYEDLLKGYDYKYIFHKDNELIVTAKYFDSYTINYDQKN